MLKDKTVRQNIEKALDIATANFISFGEKSAKEGISYKVPKACKKEEVHETGVVDLRQGLDYVNLEEIPITSTQLKIAEITDAMKDLLLYKNKKYGDSAINPKKIFYKGDSTNSILIRLDDKVGRVMSNPDEKPRVNDVCDIIGYCVLLLISLEVTKDDIAKFKD